jgi:hypothetical protein
VCERDSWAPYAAELGAVAERLLEVVADDLRLLADAVPGGVLLIGVAP